MNVTEFILIGLPQGSQMLIILFLVLLSIYIREGNGAPLRYPRLENPMDGEPGRLQSMGSLRVRHD